MNGLMTILRLFRADLTEIDCNCVLRLASTSNYNIERHDMLLLPQEIRAIARCDSKIASDCDWLVHSASRQ